MYNILLIIRKIVRIFLTIILSKNMTKSQNNVKLTKFVKLVLS